MIKNSLRKMPAKHKIKKGDKVVILSGKDKKKIGEVARVFPKSGKVIVEGINVKVKHIKPQGDNKGKILKVPSPIDISNVMYYSERNKGASRFSVKILKDGSKTRYMRKFDDLGDEYEKRK
jgi:large subunit ribosomal protein L24